MTNVVYFISHVAIDFSIADALRQELEDWGIVPGEIFLAQRPGLGPVVGENIDKALADALRQSKVFFLIFTFDNRDWRYPFYELGLAREPGKEYETRLVIFQCSNSTPKVHQDILRVQVTDDNSIRNFTEQFHTVPGFIPGMNVAIYPDISPRVIERRSQSLFKTLNERIPGRERRERFLWPYLRLGIPMDSTQEILQIRTEQDAEITLKAILSEKAIIQDSDPTALQHFDLAEYFESRLFGELASSWNSKVNGEFAFPSDEQWIKGFSRGIWRGVCGRRPVPIRDAPLISARDSKRFHLLVASITELSDDSVEATVFMIETYDQYVNPDA